MRNTIYRLWITALIITLIVPCLYAQKATNPIIYADVPDISIVRAGNSYYMSSTTMHMSPRCTDYEVERFGELEAGELCI